MIYISFFLVCQVQYICRNHQDERSQPRKGSRLQVWFGTQPTRPWHACLQLLPRVHCLSAAWSRVRQGSCPPPWTPARPLQRPRWPGLEGWSPWTWDAGRRWRCSSTCRTWTSGGAGRGSRTRSRRGSRLDPQLVGSVGGRPWVAPPSNVATARAVSSPARFERRLELPLGELPCGSPELSWTWWWPSSAAPWTTRSTARRSGPGAPWSEPTRSPWGVEGGQRGTCGRDTRRRRGQSSWLLLGGYGGHGPTSYYSTVMTFGEYTPRI